MDQYSRQRQRTAGAVLSEKDVSRIKRLLRTGEMSARQLADVFDVGLETIRRIKRGETWSWVSADAEHKVLTDSREIQQAMQERLEREGLTVENEAPPSDPYAGYRTAAEWRAQAPEHKPNSVDDMIDELSKTGDSDGKVD